jgi:hypothetical protein
MKDESWYAISEFVEKCHERIRSIESVMELLVGSARFFRDRSLSPPTRGCSELVFLRSIFWLHGLFHECGGRPLRYCLRQSQFQDTEGKGRNYLEELSALRTDAAHNLDQSSERDKATAFICQQWFLKTCQKTPPMPDECWSSCTLALLSGAYTLLERVNAFLSKLKTLDNADLLVEELQRSIVGQVPPYIFDEIVSSVADDLGRSRTDLIKFRVDHFSNWITALDRLTEGYDFQHEARRLVEESFLASPEKSPVSGRDIITELGIPAGKEVGSFLLHAQRIYEGGISDKAEILKVLRGHRASAFPS